MQDVVTVTYTIIIILLIVLTQVSKYTEVYTVCLGLHVQLVPIIDCKGILIIYIHDYVLLTITVGSSVSSLSLPFHNGVPFSLCSAQL